jgi:hypothetical protein
MSASAKSHKMAADHHGKGDHAKAVKSRQSLQDGPRALGEGAYQKPGSEVKTCRGEAASGLAYFAPLVSHDATHDAAHRLKVPTKAIHEVSASEPALEGFACISRR